MSTRAYLSIRGRPCRGWPARATLQPNTRIKKKKKMSISSSSSFSSPFLLSFKHFFRSVFFNPFVHPYIPSFIYPSIYIFPQFPCTDFLRESEGRETRTNKGGEARKRDTLQQMRRRRKLPTAPVTHIRSCASSSCRSQSSGVTVTARVRTRFFPPSLSLSPYTPSPPFPS